MVPYLLFGACITICKYNVSQKKLQIFGVKYGTIRHIYALSITRMLQNCFIALNFVGLKGDYAGFAKPYVRLVTLMVEFVADS